MSTKCLLSFSDFQIKLSYYLEGTYFYASLLFGLKCYMFSICERDHLQLVFYIVNSNIHFIDSILFISSFRKNYLDVTTNRYIFFLQFLLFVWWLISDDQPQNFSPDTQTLLACQATDIRKHCLFCHFLWFYKPQIEIEK